MSAENVSVVRNAIAAYNSQDLQTMRSLTHPDLELDWSASRGLDAGVYKGAEKAMRFYQDFFEFFEEIIIKPDRFIDSGESVVVPNAAHIRGRDGIETLARSALVFKVSAGRVTSIRLYQETHEAFAAIGLSE